MARTPDGVGAVWLLVGAPRGKRPRPNRLGAVESRYFIADLVHHFNIC